MSITSLQWWWLSFCDGDQFLGVAIVGPAYDINHAVRCAWKAGINPGGEAAGLPLFDDFLALVDTDHRHRLLNEAEARELAAAVAKRMTKQPKVEIPS